jgi:TIR domain
MAHDVFISHSAEDKPAADAVCAILEKNGVRCWIAPRDMTPGADWGESIVNAIRKSRILLLVFSTNANKSKQIKREVEIAADGSVTIVPLRIENTLPTESFKYFLGNIHWLDALTPPLEKHLEEVAAKVKAILGTESTDSSEAFQRSLPRSVLPVQPPGRRNVLLVIGGIVAGLILVLAALLSFGPLKKTTPAGPVPSSTQPVPAGFFPMIVRGGPGVTTSYNEGVLTVTITKAPVAAGDSDNYDKLEPGSAAWVDRALSQSEAFILKQTVDEENAKTIVKSLQDPRRYWRFFCASTDRGYFDVFRSESAK